MGTLSGGQGVELLLFPERKNLCRERNDLLGAGKGFDVHTNLWRSRAGMRPARQARAVKTRRNAATSPASAPAANAASAASVTQSATVWFVERANANGR